MNNLLFLGFKGFSLLKSYTPDPAPEASASWAAGIHIKIILIYQ